MAGLPRGAAILQRIAADVDELARAGRAAGLGAAAAFRGRRAGRLRGPDLGFREFCRRSKLPRSERSWDLFAAGCCRRGGTGIAPYQVSSRFRHRQPGLCT